MAGLPQRMSCYFSLGFTLKRLSTFEGASDSGTDVSNSQIVALIMLDRALWIQRLQPTGWNRLRISFSEWVRGPSKLPSTGVFELTGVSRVSSGLSHLASTVHDQVVDTV